MKMHQIVFTNHRMYHRIHRACILVIETCLGLHIDLVVTLRQEYAELGFAWCSRHICIVEVWVYLGMLDVLR